MPVRLLGARHLLKVFATLVAGGIAFGIVGNGAFGGGRTPSGVQPCGSSPSPPSGGYRVNAAGYGGGGSSCPAPEAGKNVNIQPLGTVLIRNSAGRFVPLRSGAQVPLGSVLDTREGSVTLTSASNTSGGTQTGQFSAGVFKVTQTSGRRPYTVLSLQGPLRASGASSAGVHSAARRRRLFGNARGRFRTRGRHAAATVRGTQWLTEDRPTGTFVKVTVGSVFVRDFRKRRTVRVDKGERYLAKAP